MCGAVRPATQVPPVVGIGGAQERLRREVRRLSQPKVAELAHVSLNYIGLIERGQKMPTVDTLVHVGKALELEPVALLGNVQVTDDWLDEAAIVAATVAPACRNACRAQGVGIESVGTTCACASAHRKRLAAMVVDASSKVRMARLVSAFVAQVPMNTRRRAARAGQRLRRRGHDAGWR